MANNQRRNQRQRSSQRVTTSTPPVAGRVTNPPGAIVNLTGANNAVGINQAAYTPTAADGVLGGQFGNVPGLKPANPFASIQNNPLARTTPTLPGLTTANLTGANMAAPYTGSVAALTGANNSVGVNQYNYLTPLQKAKWDADKRQQQITQLTTPYTGSLAAITGANMFQPSNLGFPGTDPRQRPLISNATLGIPNPPPVLDLGGGSVGGGGGGGGGYRRSGGGGGLVRQPYQETTYGNSVATQVMNWRLATG